MCSLQQSRIELLSISDSYDIVCYEKPFHAVQVSWNVFGFFSRFTAGYMQMLQYKYFSVNYVLVAEMLHVALANSHE